MKNAFSLVVFIIFFIMLASVGSKVNAKLCQEPLGGCLFCKDRCTNKYGSLGRGICGGNHLCTCEYVCSPSQGPPQPKQCYGGPGGPGGPGIKCGSACNDNCGKYYSGGSGFCESNLCKCRYPC
ncbi:unnamed protein product [Thlaspi arvense]|uniref:Defensin-like protein n=1 Tax=Thlaspi arvense TaxID=13288 RepID=A0AAU9T1J5_THLAR|nr:unnamed protein product [Thlaspi arvense]